VIDHIDAFLFEGSYILVAEDGENLNSRKLPLALRATGKFWVNNHAHVLRARSESADGRFLLSWLNHADIKPFVTGAAQPKLSQANLRRIEVPLPPLPIQRRIAGILSAYDDLMENNLRRIRILEEMARALYSEWFVHFRFPGHNSVPRVESSLGPIPQGWHTRSLGELCRLTMGQSPKSEFYNDDGAGLPFHQGVSDFGDRFPTERLFCSIEGRAAGPGDILFSVRAPVGRMNLALKQMVIGRGLSAIRHGRNRQAFLWEQLRDQFKKEDMIGNGAIFAAVTKQDMQRIELLCPPDVLVDSADELLRPIHGAIERLTSTNLNLRRTRDLLLPRLLSGRVRFPETESA